MKYKNRKVEIDGIRFDSVKEARRYQELKLLEKAGVIKNLELQKKFILIPAQREPDGVGRTGRPVKGHVIERETSYKADFTYTENGRTVVEDVKGVKTKEYIIKRKLMLYIHGIKIKEV
jgi:Fe2+ or Zn2+ uptake regulation protein